MAQSVTLVYHDYSLRLLTRVRIKQNVVPGHHLVVFADSELGSGSVGFSGSQLGRVGRKPLEATGSSSGFSRWEDRPET